VGILDGFHPGRESGVLVVPEIGLLYASGKNEVVIVELDLLTQRALRKHPSFRRVDPGDLGQHEVEVADLSQQAAQGMGDLPLGQDAGGVLVEQRREQVVLRPVEQGHLNRRLAQCPGGEQAGEPPADDHYPPVA
jgi:hypothetical protein